MNNGLKYTLIFVAGAAAGAGGAYMALKSVFEARYNEEVMQVREAYGKALDGAKNASEGHSERDICEEATESVQEPEEKEVKSIRTVPLPDGKPDLDELVQKIDYTKYNKKSEEPESKDVVVAELDIEYIDCVEYDDDEDGYSKRTLTYFEIDDTYIDNHTEEIVKDALKLIGGPDTIDHIGMYEENMVHVKNHTNNTKYEVIREVDQTYYDYTYNFN